jgi:hypothetical protein
MMIRFHGSRMVSVFPESSLPLFPLIELLSGAAGDQLHGPGNYFAFPAVKHEQMDMVRCGHIVEDAQPIPFLGFKEPAHPRSAVFGKFEKKFFLVAPVGYVPDVSGQEVSFGSGHGKQLSCG